MAYVDDLTTARDNVAAILAEISADPKPDYSVGGQSISWSAYFQMLTTQLEALNKAIQQAGAPYWRVSRAKP